MEIKDKPKSMSIREWITKKVAIAPEIVTPENIITAVIRHSYDSANDALLTNNSIEISGFGKFYYNVKKAQKELEKCQKTKKNYEAIISNEASTDKERKKAEILLKAVTSKIETLLLKKDG